MAYSQETLAVQIHNLEKLMDIKFRAQQDALKLQAAEYERRLDMLNGEAGRIAHILSLNVNRELFERFHNEHERRLNDIDKSRANTEGKVWGISAAIGVAFTLINILVRFLS